MLTNYKVRLWNMTSHKRNSPDHHPLFVHFWISIYTFAWKIIQKYHTGSSHRNFKYCCKYFQNTATAAMVSSTVGLRNTFLTHPKIPN